MPGSNDIITVGSTFLHAYTCDHEHYELTTAIINSAELPQLGEMSTLAVLDCNKPTSSTAFHPLEETKAVGIDPVTPQVFGFHICTAFHKNEHHSSIYEFILHETCS